MQRWFVSEGRKCRVPPDSGKVAGESGSHSPRRCLALGELLVAQLNLTPEHGESGRSLRPEWTEAMLPLRPQRTGNDRNGHGPGSPECTATFRSGHLDHRRQLTSNGSE